MTKINFYLRQMFSSSARKKLLGFLKSNGPFLLAAQVPNSVFVACGFLSSPLLSLQASMIIFLGKFKYSGIVLLWLISLIGILNISSNQFIFLLSNWNGQTPNYESFDIIIVSLVSLGLSFVFAIVLSKYTHVFWSYKKALFYALIVFVVALLFYYSFASEVTKQKVHELTRNLPFRGYLYSLVRAPKLGFGDYYDVTRNFFSGSYDAISDVSNTDDFNEDMNTAQKRALKDNGNIIIIINESWTKLINPQLNQAILNPLFTSKEWQYDYGEKNWSKDLTTVAAELQTICGHSLPNIQAKANTFMSKESSLLYMFQKSGQCGRLLEFKDAGYQMTFAHSAKCEYGHRCDYKELFDKVSFYNYFVEKGMKKCNYGWLGVCDGEVMHQIGQGLNRNLIIPKPKSFQVFLSVNTHAPMPSLETLNVEYNFNCKNHYATRQNSNICALAKLQNYFFQEIAQNLIPKMSKNDILIILGDHPIYLMKHYDKKFINKKVVPYVIVRKKNEN